MSLPTGLVLRPVRMFKNRYVCDACDFDWTDDMLMISHSWCPECEARNEPWLSEPFLEDMLCDADEEVE